MPLTLAWLGLAFWPVWPYLARRAVDGSDDPWGLLAALTLLVVARKPRAGWGVGVGLILYAGLAPWLPELVRAALAMGVLGMALGGRPGVLGLCLLSLPSLASLQFYLGYPLRLLVASGAAVLLGVGRQGLVIDHSLAVDAPCSGLSMLWALLYLASLLAVRRNLDGRIFGVAVLAAVGGNILRATSLYYAGRLGIGHEPVGLAAFALACLVVAAAGLRMPPRAAELASQAVPVAAGGLEPVAETGASGPEGLGSWVSLPGRAGACGRAVALASRAVRGAATAIGLGCRAVAGTGLGRPGQAALGPALGGGGCPRWLPLACLMAAAAGLGNSLPQADSSGFPGWPQGLVPLPLSELELEWQRGFPGRIGRFQEGDHTLVLRWVKAPTRLLHSSADCYRGLGYSLSPATWCAGHSRFEATRGDEKLVVEEWIEDAKGHAFPDVSSWYWAALWGQSRGPWWAHTVARRAP